MKVEKKEKTRNKLEKDGIVKVLNGEQYKRIASNYIMKQMC